MPGQSLGFKVWHSFSRIVDRISHNFESFLKKPLDFMVMIIYSTICCLPCS